MKNKSVKLSVNLPTKTAELLRSHATIRDITMTEYITKALGVQDLIDNEIARGSKILFHRTDGSYHEIILKD